MAHGDGSKSRITWRNTLAASFPQWIPPWILLKVDRREARDDSLIFSFILRNSFSREWREKLQGLACHYRNREVRGGYIHVDERRGMPLHAEHRTV